MCGISGVFKKNNITQRDIDLVQKMNDAQKHRGPDDEGIFHDSHCCLGHRRLSIIDLSKDGHQPFSSDDGRLELIYNGEIFNYKELRAELESLGWGFRTKTDTEVLLKAYQQFGAKCLSRFNGMFSFVIYDKKKNTLFLARDRMGIKPLYYHRDKNNFYFASEIKALKNNPDLCFSYNPQALFDFLIFNRTDIDDETFFNEIKRIPKGTYAYFDGENLRIHQWWNPRDYLNEIEDNEEAVSKKIDELLVSATTLRMRSDVPVGSCLSGGLDSTILLGIIYSHRLAGSNYRSFTASFPDFSFDETKYIDILNKKYPFSNVRTYVDGDTAFKNLNHFVYTNEDPTPNSSYYTQFEVMRLAKENGVTVLIDGQGGDEVFAGYDYFNGFYLNELYCKENKLKFIAEFISSFYYRKEKDSRKTFYFQFFSERFRQSCLMWLTRHVNPEFIKRHASQSIIFNEFSNVQTLNESLVRHFQYKLEHLLRMEDKNSMAFSIEARVPYLDYRLVEYLLGISGKMKWTIKVKRVLQKKALGRYTADEIVNRQDKVGFETPFYDWMKQKNWHDLAHDSWKYVTSHFSGVFDEKFGLPDSAQERWKIIQLAKCMEIFG